HCEYLWSLKVLLAQSHTANLIAKELDKIIQIIAKLKDISGRGLKQYINWISLEDSFPKNEDYIVQLALKLFSIIPHTAGVEHVWSRLGWLYGKRRNRLGLHKIKNM
ncbi:45728_t:CDS:2, partial [Gigaspora margarita]